MASVICSKSDPFSRASFEYASMQYGHCTACATARAISDFSRAEDLAPESPAPAIEMGNLFFVRKEYAKAISHFDQALQLQPQPALALARRGTAHLHRKDQAAALADRAIARFVFGLASQRAAWARRVRLFRR